jgi:hypothetical protein
MRRALLVCLPLALACNGGGTVNAGGTLLRVDQEAAGACAAGGAVISAGADDNQNGQLEAAEVETSAVVCNGIDGQDGQGVQPLGPQLDGSFQALNQADLNAISGVVSITGNLTINVDGLSTASLPALTTVQGTLSVVGGRTLTSISLPALTAVQGDVNISFGQALTSISLPALTTVGGFLQVRNNPLLPTCQAEALAAQLSAPPPGGVIISGNNDAGVCP